MGFGAKMRGAVSGESNWGLSLNAAKEPRHVRKRFPGYHVCGAHVLC